MLLLAKKKQNTKDPFSIDQTFFLNKVPAGNTVLVKNICGGHEERNRLYAMGITPGARIKVSQESKYSSIIFVRDCPMVLCSEIASKIECRTCEDMTSHIASIDNLCYKS